MLKTKIKKSYSSIEYLNYFFIIILISIISCKSGSSGKSETSESKEISDSIENYKDKIKKFNHYCPIKKYKVRGQFFNPPLYFFL